MLLAGLLLILATASRAVPGSDGGSWSGNQNGGDAPACLEFGAHTAALPERDPLFWPNVCHSDPLEDPVRFQAAWNKLLDRIKKGGGKPIPYGDSTVNGYKQVINAGASMGEVTEEKSWGDVAWIFLQEDQETPRTTQVWVYRAYRYLNGAKPRVLATAVVFDADRHGVLELVQKSDGELDANGRGMAWSPLTQAGGGNSISATYVREWHQLLEVLNQAP